jgi:cystathionine beta-lyase/cystathionine gamma-synthase
MRTIAIDDAKSDQWLRPQLFSRRRAPAVFPSWTCVFSSPEVAERAFEFGRGAAQPVLDEAADLIYARLHHPKPGIQEYQGVPLENRAGTALLFSSCMAAITTALPRSLRA